MAITYRIGKTAKLIRARVFGEISFDEFRTTLREVLEDPDFDPSFGRLWNIRGARSILSGQDVRGIAEVVRKFVGGRRSAVVAQLSAFLRGPHHFPPPRIRPSSYPTNCRATDPGHS